MERDMMQVQYLHFLLFKSEQMLSPLANAQTAFTFACPFSAQAILLVLQVFIDSRYVNVDGGRYLKDHEIAGMLIASLFAGQHTSSITSSWTGYFMISNQVCCSVLALGKLPLHYE